MRARSFLWACLLLPNLRGSLSTCRWRDPVGYRQSREVYALQWNEPAVRMMSKEAPRHWKEIDSSYETVGFVNAQATEEVGSGGSMGAELRDRVISLDVHFR